MPGYPSPLMHASTLRCLTLLIAFAIGIARGADAADADGPVVSRSVWLVMGASGDPDLADSFLRQVHTWQETAARAGITARLIGDSPENPTNDGSRLRDALAGEPTNGNEELWLVLIGHGTFDGREAKFNLRGPDVSATELASWLNPIHRPVIVVDTTSASAPFLNKLKATNRVVVTATRSGNEQNYSRFGSFLAEAIANPAADLDQDGQTSLLEAFLSASHRSAEFYQSAGRLATEHALLDDNGDGQGTPADWFRGILAVKKPKKDVRVDGLRAHQVNLVPSAAERQLTPERRRQRDELERQVAQLREEKTHLSEVEYYLRLEKLLLELARI